MQTNLPTLTVPVKQKNPYLHELLLLLIVVFSLVITLNTSAQTPVSFPCNSTTLTNSNGYYGGFEAGGTNGINNFLPGAASTDYAYGNGQTEYQILMNTFVQNGYLPVLPHSGDYFLTSHTSSSRPDLKLWYKTLAVSPGQTFQVCAWIADLKINPVGGFPINIVVNTNVGSTVIATETISSPLWMQICGTYTVPAGVTSIDVEIEDPTPSFNGSSHFLGLDDICISEIPQLNLGNTVWYDANNDGIKQTSEKGIGGVAVNLYVDANNDNIPDGAAIATTTTGATGTYNFANLISTNYIVGVVLPSGYAAGAVTATSATPNNDIDNDNNGVTTGTEVRSNAITLLVGTEPTTDGDGANGNLTLDFGLRGTGSIGNFVFNDANGNGLQDAGEVGISGVTVTISSAINGVTATAITDANGNYTFANLAPGTDYVVSFTTPVGFTATTANVGGNDATDSDPVGGTVTGVTVGAGVSNTSVDAGFYQAVSLGNTVFYDANNDGIKQLTEKGIAGAVVNLYADANNDNIADGAAIRTAAITDANGLYSFANLIPGNYIVGVTIPSGYAAVTLNGGDPDNNVDNDNNGVTIVGTEVRSNAITLVSGTEPTTDGDGANGNLTLDFGLLGAQIISGNIFVDKDGLKDNNINQSGGVNNTKTNIGGMLYANLLNTAGQVVASTPILADGTYLFNGVLLGTYFVQLTTNSSMGTYDLPATAPASSLPEGWVNTGEFNGNTAGNDGSINGKSASFTLSANETKTEVNFGIERLPESVSQNTFIPTPSVNTIIKVNDLTGSDPEDQPITGALTGKTIQITALPTNSQLLYNGVPVVINQLITNYTPALLQIKFTTATAASSTQFSFAYVDAAGFADRTPATYTVNWASAGPLPISLIDFTATKQPKVVDLNWQTSNEQNSSHFDVEFSKDGSEFQSIGKVNAAGNSSTTKNYASVHQSPVNGVNYYRLKLVDVDGSFKYSAVRTVKFSGSTSIKIMPNPTADRVYITSNEGGVLQSVGLYSIDGKLLQQVTNFNLGKSIDLSNYKPSIYILKLIDKDGTTEVIRVVKK